MRSYGQYCPVAVGSEVLTERWTLLVLRELLIGGTRFNDFAQGLPKMNRTLLSARLKRLEDAGIVARAVDEDGPTYTLTPAGRALEPIVWAIGDWAMQWALGEPKRDELDPMLLLWWMRASIRHDAVPARRTTIEFAFTGRPSKRGWLVVDRREATSCWRHPGLEVDVRVTSALADLYRVWVGRTDLREAIASGLVHVEGPPSLVRALPSWFAGSRFAPAVTRSA